MDDTHPCPWRCAVQPVPQISRSGQGRPAGTHACCLEPRPELDSCITGEQAEMPTRWGRRHVRAAPQGARARAHRDSASAGSCGYAEDALRVHSASSTSATGTASCVTTASRSRRALSARFTHSPRHCCAYSAAPCASRGRHPCWAPVCVAAGSVSISCRRRALLTSTPAHTRPLWTHSAPAACRAGAEIPPTPPHRLLVQPSHTTGRNNSSPPHMLLAKPTQTRCKHGAPSTSPAGDQSGARGH